MSLFKRKKPTPSENLSHAAAVIKSADALLEMKTMKIIGNSVYLYPELLQNKKTAEKWFKNLFIYCSLKNGHQSDQRLYFKNIENDVILGFFENKKAVVLF